MNFRPWLRLFRAPNLATAAGDAMAGGATFAIAAGSAAANGGFAASGPVFFPLVRASLCAGAAELFLYMAGLADNDLADEIADRASGKSRPLADGALRRRDVVAARAACFALAAAAGLVGAMPGFWWAAFATLAACILAYNRAKEKLPGLGVLLMGLCRGLGVALGALAAVSTLVMPGERDFNAQDGLLFSAHFALSLCVATTAYTSAVTRLGLREESAAAPLRRRRYLPALVPLFPMALPIALVIQFAVARVPGTNFKNYAPLLGPVFFALCASLAWTRAVRPLGKPHGPAERGRAVGRAIGGLLWMQTSFLIFGLAAPGTSLVVFPIYAALCHALRFAFRSIPGS